MVNSPVTEGPVVISSLVRVLWLAGLSVSVQKISVEELKLNMAPSLP